MKTASMYEFEILSTVSNFRVELNFSGKRLTMTPQLAPRENNRNDSKGRNEGNFLSIVRKSPIFKNNNILSFNKFIQEMIHVHIFLN